MSANAKPLRQLAPGMEVPYLYKEFREKLGVDAFDAARRQKDNVGNTHILETLNIMNLMTFEDSANFIFEIFSPHMDGRLGCAKVEQVEIKDGKTFYEGKPVVVCHTPTYLQRTFQLILPYNQLSDLQSKLKNGNVQIQAKETNGFQSSSVSSQKHYSFLEVVEQAIKKDASDIHINYGINQYTVYFRIDGVAVRQKEFLMNLQQGKELIDDAKRLAAASSFGKFNPDIKTKGQDARVELPQLGVNLRLSILPDGLLREYSMVIRLLKRQSLTGIDENFPLQLNYGQKFADDLNYAKRRKGGLIISSGITGSGKTTLIAYTIASLPDTEMVITVEDPIEYTLDKPSVLQAQIYDPPSEEDGTPSKDRMNWSEFAKQIKRHDPDIVSFGELRNDKEQIATIQELIEAGQLVFVSTHIKSAFEIYKQLEKIFGMSMDSLAGTIHFSVNQVLARKLCDECKVKDESNINSKVLEELQQKNRINYLYTGPLSAFIQKGSSSFDSYVRGKGCAKCNFEGYKGRVPVYEYFMPDVSFKQWVESQKPSQYDIEVKVCEEGLGNNRLMRLIELIQEGKVDASVETLRKIF